ncbi:MAG: electron transfer flavoprotein subunit alpha/FixB family protein [Kiritimatiellaeota bacterium]|nr:electron transfer flavoprotein subunit alpha/FixB family protein [Kiritimatiellota bacterium]
MPGTEKTTIGETAFQGVWVLGEQRDGRVLRITHELIARGRTLADKCNARLTAVLVGRDFERAALDDLIARGADAVLAVKAPELAHFRVEPVATCLVHLIEMRRPAIVLAGATSTGRTLAPYIAARTEAGLTADCTELDIEAESGGLIQIRPAIGGNIMASIRTPDHRPQMATVRPRSTRPAKPVPGRTGRIETLKPPRQWLHSRTRRTGFTPSPDEHGLHEAEVVVVAGRGIGKAENLDTVRALADSLDAALGASREVVDRGWHSYPHQVGLSGKTITPRLYVGVGVSGAIQHLAGMQTSEHVIAINNDPDAPIFQVADIGIVGDLFDVLPVLTRKLQQARHRARAALSVKAREP